MSARELYWQALADCKGFARYVDNRLKPFYCPLQQRNNHGVYAVNMNARVGLFAQLTWYLYILNYCERFNLTPHVVFSSPFYTLAKGDNWFDYYFENVKLTQADRENIERGLVTVSSISHINHLALPSGGAEMTIEHASKLFAKYVRINDEIQDCVQSFVDKHFGQKTVLGIHYRGTDKKSEAKQVAWEYCARTISNYLGSNPQVEALFVASDEGAFVEWIETEFKHVEVISHDDKERSRDGKAIHVQASVGDNYVKGKEALVNCLLLSRCSALIRTASALSAWSSIFNPALPVIMLNKPYGDKFWFPDSAIVERSMNAYLPG